MERWLQLTGIHVMQMVLVLKRVLSRYFNGIEQNKMYSAIDLNNATSAGTGEDHDRDGRNDYTDKSDPIREHDCIWCMACVSARSLTTSNQSRSIKPRIP